MKRIMKISAAVTALALAGTLMTSAGAADIDAYSQAEVNASQASVADKSESAGYTAPMTTDRTSKRYKDFIAAKPYASFGSYSSYYYEPMLYWGEVGDALLYYVYKKTGSGYTMIGKTVNNFYYLEDYGTYYVRAVTYDYNDKKIMSKASDTVEYPELTLYGGIYDYDEGDGYFEEEAVYDDYADVEYEADYSVAAGASVSMSTVAPSGVSETPDNEEYTSYENDTFKKASDTPLSTFSADVDTASYANVRRLANDGYKINPDAVRTEEFLNYFDYKYKEPTKGNFMFTYEYTDCPWNKNAMIVMLGVHAKDVEKEPNSNLVFLIDVSGSMYSADKLPLVQESLKKLSQTLTKNDRISIVTYSGNENAVISGAYGNMKNCISEIADSLEADGVTNGEKGLTMAYEIAAANYIKDGNNRVIMATDGDLNVGISDKDDLSEFISQKRDTGVYLTMLGFGTGNLKDDRMEALAKDGNGNYHYIDCAAEAQKVLVDERKKTLITVADDVKLQVEFNPTLVDSYRLIGYEGRRLKNEDFDNDKKDAADMGAGQSITVMYEIIPAESSSDSLKYQKSTGNTTDICTVKLRYKKPGTAKSLLSKCIVKKSAYCKYTDTGVRFRFAACVAETAMYLRGDTAYGTVSIESAKKRLSKLTKAELAQIGYSDDFVDLLDKLTAKQ